MENVATNDTSGCDGHDCSGGGRTAAQDSVQSASAVTEVGSSGNAAAAAEETRRPGLDETEVGSSGNAAAAAEETRRPGLDDGRGEDYGWLTVLERTAVDDYYGPVEAEMMAVSQDVQPSMVRLAATRFGWLLLGFLAGAAAAVLFLMHQESPTTCTVTVPT